MFQIFIFMFAVVTIGTLSFYGQKLKKGTVKAGLSKASKVIYKTGDDKKCELLGYTFGYLIAKNSDLNNPFLYKYIWDTAYSQKFNKTQITGFFSYFNKGKNSDDAFIENLFSECAFIWEKDRSEIALFNILICILFYDNFLTMREKNTFFKIAKWMKIGNQTATQIFNSYLKKYKFIYNEESGNYISTYKFSSPENNKAGHLTGNMDQNIQEAYLFLNIDENASAIEAETAYRNLLKSYVPKQTEIASLPAEMADRYLEICNTIEKAWNLIKQYRHW